MTVDAQGQILTYTDPNGTKHAYSYDSLRRLVADTITTFGANVDQTVAKIGTAYDAQGNPYLTTSYAGDGGIVNQIMRLFNGFGQITQEFQSASGAVDPATTPSVQYSYSTPTGYEETVSGSSSGSGSGSGSSSAYSRYISEANNSRLAAIIYPDGYTVNFTYNSGTDDAISRVSSVSDTSGTLASLTYRGLGTVMSTSFGSGINSAITLDQFANIASISWTPTGSDTPISAYAYTHDDDGNTLSKTDEVNADFSQLNTFNNVNEQTGYQEGPISGGTIASPAHSQSLDLDALGNINSNTVDGGTAQTRTVNAQSEYTAVSGVTATPTYDNDGDMTTDSAGLQYVYSAWNLPVKVLNSAGTATLETFENDGLGRRIAITIGDTTTNLYYSGSEVLEESSGGDYTNRYVWNPTNPNSLILRDSAVEVGPTVRLWAVSNANNDVVALVLSGSVVERYDYTPSGADQDHECLVHGADEQRLRLD